MSNQAVSVLSNVELREKERGGITTGDPLKANQIKSDRFLYFIIMVSPDQEYPKNKYIHMYGRKYLQPPLYTVGIDDIINNQIINTHHEILVHLADLSKKRKPEIGNIKKERGDVFSECRT